MAFGDQYNDVEMLQLAGTSYTMSNAAPGISFYSTYVTDSVPEVLDDIISSVGIWTSTDNNFPRQTLSFCRGKILSRSSSLQFTSSS